MPAVEMQVPALPMCVAVPHVEQMQALVAAMLVEARHALRTRMPVLLKRALSRVAAAMPGQGQEKAVQVIPVPQMRMCVLAQVVLEMYARPLLEHVQRRAASETPARLMSGRVPPMASLAPAW
jgi:hypothetical protein